MFKNYFKTAYRYIKKNKFFSSINILGLSAGLAVCILIITFVFDEFSYDKFNKKADRIFRIESDIQVNGNGINGNYVPAPMALTMVKDFPQIETAVRIRRQQYTLVKKGNENIMESNAVFADASLFDIFTLPMIAGVPSTALAEPNSMVISESIAKKYFKSADVLGKTMLIDNTTTYKITGVITDMPAESHFHFDFIKTLPEIDNFNFAWLNPWATTYLLAKPGVSLKDINSMLAAVVKKYVGPQLQQMNPVSSGDVSKNGDFFRYYAMPLHKIHLFSNVAEEFEPNGNIQTVYIFIIIAILILIMACVNFMNLSTSASSRRSVEIGIRKVLGGARRNLVAQFLLESILISLVATLLAILFAILLLPYFNELAGKHISLRVLFKGWMILLYLFLALFVGLIAGSYPAFYLSAFKPVSVLKEFLITGNRNSWLRNSLVIFQFVIANILIVSTLVIYSQFSYIRERDLGYNRNQLLTIANTYKLGIHAKTFKDEVAMLPGVVGGTMTAFLPNHDVGGARAYFKDATAKVSETFLLSSWTVEANYVPLLGMKIVRGRNFSPFMPGDSSCVLINETAARLLGYSTDPVNKAIYFHDSNPIGGFKIVGVVKDFNASTLRDKIEPVVFHLGEDIGAISFRINTKNIPSLIGLIKEKYNSMDVGNEPFVYSFLDDDFNNLYKADERTGKIYITFTVFAILISCLGLFALVAYAAEQRTKEIGIRKVLGASTGNLLRLLSKDFLKLIVIAIVIACPLAFWGSYKWLENFAYRTNIGIWVFLTAGFLTLVITMITIFFQSMKVALVNPAKILRSE